MVEPQEVESEAKQAYAWLQKTAQALHLKVHPDKSRVLHVGGGVDGFDFLGFHHRMVRSRKTGRLFCHRWPSRRAMASVRAKVKKITAPTRPAEVADGCTDKRAQPGTARLGQLPPVGTLCPRVHPGLQPRPRAPP